MEAEESVSEKYETIALNIMFNIFRFTKRDPTEWEDKVDCRNRMCEGAGDVMVSLFDL